MSCFFCQNVIFLSKFFGSRLHDASIIIVIFLLSYNWQGDIIMNKDVIYVRIDEDLKKALDMLALEEQRSLNNLVVRILTKHVEQKKKEMEKTVGQ